MQKHSFLKMKHANIPIFIPELACPHQCVFCNQSKISGQSSIPTPQEIPSIIEKYLSTMGDEKEVEIAFFGGSFTGIPYDLQEEYLKHAYPYVENGRIKGIRLSTRPDYIDEKRLDLLKKYGVTTIELGAQSTNEEVLLASGRGHKRKAIWNASSLIRDWGVHLGLQMMIGLPYDTYERSLQTVKDIISLGADNTRIYPTLVIRDTALARLYESGRYTPLDLETAVSWAKDFYRMFEEAGLTILRVGLHPSEELTNGKSLLAGPFHKSFKELVMTEIWKSILSEKIVTSTSHNIVLSVHPSQINYVNGYEGRNKKWLNEQGISIKVMGDNKLKKYDIRIDSHS